MKYSYTNKNTYSLANSEARLALAKIFWHFDLHLQQPEDGTDWERSLKSFFIFTKMPLMVVLGDRIGRGGR